MSDIKERLALECPRRSVDAADHSLCLPHSLCVPCAALDRLSALERELAEARETIAKLRGELDGQCQHGIAEDEECEECEKAAHEYMRLLDERQAWARREP